MPHLVIVPLAALRSEAGEREHGVELLLGVVEEMAGLPSSLQLPDLEVERWVAERRISWRTSRPIRTEDSGDLRHGAERARFLGETQAPDDQVELPGIEGQAMQRTGVEEHVGGAHGAGEPAALVGQFLVWLH